MRIIKDQDKQCEIVGMLTKAYWMEIETVMSYIAGATNPDGVRAEEVKKSLEGEITDELGHAQQYAKRIKELYGQVPGSMEFKAVQSFLQPPSDAIDIVSVIRGVIEAEGGAIDFYQKIIDVCDGVDYVTQDMVINILRDEERHLRLFEGFLREYDAAAGGAAQQARRVREAHPGTKTTAKPGKTQESPVIITPVPTEH